MIRLNLQLLINMKKLFLLLFSQLVFSQANDTQEGFRLKTDLTIKGFMPVHFGTNFLSKSNTADIGVGIFVDFIKFNKFSVGTGFNYTYYSISDVTRGGNIRSSRLNSFYGNVSYAIDINENLKIIPDLGFGSATINFKTGSRNYGSQNGNELRIGVTTNYKLSDFLYATAGLNYVSAKYYINTTPEFVSFYDNSKILQLSLGLKFY